MLSMPKAYKGRINSKCVPVRKSPKERKLPLTRSFSSASPEGLFHWS